MEKNVNIIFKGSTQRLAAASRFSDLISSINFTFNISSLEVYKLYYQDTEDDIITVTNQSDYELAIDQKVPSLTLCVANTPEDARRSIARLRPKKLLTNLEKSLLLRSEEIKEPLLYSCLNCNGTKMNRTGKKVCKFCSGTGQVGEDFLESVRETIKSELTKNFKSNIEKLIRMEEVKEVSKETLTSKITFESISDKYKTTLGIPFKKQWIIKNTGTSPWPKDTQFKKIFGDNIQATVSVVGGVKLGGVKPGEQATVKLSVEPPACAGRYFAMYALVHSAHKEFGEVAWIDFIVMERN
eukprot:TRINITY_DN2851_c0_g1_i5.p1 TRINITY_DN2851_c0_g1~~TRINITY_DN2851_c0_g1_i5.p1  ORF type:complete len:298 (+),score=79.75 TRINITY_DN2851_c0_g1_i5:82-975(+)